MFTNLSHFLQLEDTFWNEFFFSIFLTKFTPLLNHLDPLTVENMNSFD